MWLPKSKMASPSGNKMAWLVPLVVTLVMVHAQQTDNTIRPMCHSPRWFPLLIKKPYSVLLNDAFCPSFQSR